MKFYLTSNCIITIISLVCSKTPDTVWTRTFEGSSYSYGFDNGRRIIENVDQEIIITGEFKNVNNYDVFLMKLNKYGDTLWFKTFGDTGLDAGISVIEAPNSEYIILCETNSFKPNNSDIWLIKTDNAGNKIWDVVIGSNENEFATDLIRTLDGNFLIVGTIADKFENKDVLIVKFDNKGEIFKIKTLGDKYSSEFGCGICQLKDASCLIAANCVANSLQLIKTDSDLNVIWEKNYEKFETVNGIVKFRDNKSVIFGSTRTIGAGNLDFIALKIDEYGNVMWTKTYGGINSEIPGCVSTTYDEGLIFVGTTESYGRGQEDIFIIRAGNNGDTLWTRTLGGRWDDKGATIIQSKDHGFLIKGYTGSNYKDEHWVIKIQSDTIPKVSHEYIRSFSDVLFTNNAGENKVYFPNGRKIIFQKENVSSGVYILLNNQNACTVKKKLKF